MNLTSSKKTLLPSGVALGILVRILAYFGNLKNMAIRVACFIRDSVGAMKLHIAAVMQYFRPEIVGPACGSFLIALAAREYRSTAGPFPMPRLILGVIMMIGSLAFLGCPLRMVIRMVAGDLNAYVRFIGFAVEVLTGTIVLKNGFLLRRAHETEKINGAVLPVVLTVLFVLGLIITLFAFSEKGPGSMHAPAFLVLAVALLFGAIAQKCRTCSAGSTHGVILMRNSDLVTVIGGLPAVMLVFNLATSGFRLSFAGQPIAHSQHIWNILELYAVDFAAVLIGGRPLRQLVLTGQGSPDSAATFLGFLVGAVLRHNFRLAASATVAATADILAVPGGLATAGKVVVIGRIVILFIIGFASKSEEGKQEVRDMYEVDTRGLSCSESVMLTIAAPKKHRSESVKVLVSEPHTRMNVEKHVKSQGETVAVIEKGSEFEIVIE